MDSRENSYDVSGLDKWKILTDLVLKKKDSTKQYHARYINNSEDMNNLLQAQ